MASAGNQNPPGGGPFDMHKLFKPSTPPPQPTSSPAPNPSSQNFVNNVSTSNTNPNLVTGPFPVPSASYPPPTGAGSGPPYSYSPQTSPYHYHPVYAPYSNPPPHQEFANMHPQRSMSYPTPPLQPQAQTPASPHHNNFQNPPNPQNPGNPGARLMAMLSAPQQATEMPQQLTLPITQIHPTSSTGSDFSVPQNVNVSPSGPGLVVSHQGPVMRMPSSKLPKGRHLVGDQLAYDVDVRLPGEVQPQLEVTPITKYGSDPGLVLGRQIAVNKTYICYGLKLGAIRVLNINTALRSLLKGLAQVGYRFAYVAFVLLIKIKSTVHLFLYLMEIFDVH